MNVIDDLSPEDEEAILDAKKNASKPVKNNKGKRVDNIPNMLQTKFEKLGVKPNIDKLNYSNKFGKKIDELCRNSF